LLLHRLLDEGIAAAVFNENAHGGVGELPFTHAYPEVWIEDPEDEPRARGIVGEFERGAAEGRKRECPGCGEYNPAAFEICWRCAALLGDESGNS
jgi:hypothetical protein